MKLYFSALALIVSCSALVAQGFTYTFNDAAGIGFNDITFIPEAERPAGNDATTRGGQRRNVLRAAGERWAQFLNPQGPVEIEAEFRSLTCSAFSGVLASAGPNSFSRNFPGAPDPNLLYVAPLVNHLSQSDRFPDQAELSVTINLNVDEDPNCLGGDGFYYGTDGNAGSQTDLFAVLLHEIGHGLGFLTLADGDDGSLPFGRADSFTAQMFDLGQQRAWTEMTNAQRVQSSLNEPLLVWNGESTNAVARDWLTGQDREIATLIIDGFPNEILALTGVFGPRLPSSGLIGRLAFANDGVAPVRDACEDLPAGSLTGRIAVIDRGVCTFASKVRRAEAAGAIAVIIVNNQVDEVFRMGADDGGAPGIPALMVRNNIDSLLIDGANVALSLNDLRGTAQGRLRLFAPPVFEDGSSNSHWDTDPSPNLLMEPNLGALTRDDPGITLTAMREIGWDVSGIPFPNLTYNIWAEENLAGVDPNLAIRTADADGDGIDNFTEYAQGSDPLLAGDRSTPFDLEIARNPNLLSYTRNAQAADLDFEITESLDLLNFELTGTTSQFSITEIGDNERVERLFSTPTDSRFYRVEVTED